MNNILIVDDELSIRESFSLILEGKYNLLLAASGEAALKTVSDQKVDMVFLDIRMPGMNGLETLRRIKELDPDIEVVMVTAVNDVQKAGEAIKYGARDYVVKPFDVDFIARLAEQTLLRKSIFSQGNEIKKRNGREIPELIGQTEKILSLESSLGKIKGGRVLVLGEAGTEKETIAQIIHASSDRANQPFQQISLYPGMSVKNLTAQFLGWEKGTSTSALEAKSGWLEQTQAGTLFIDNIEYLPKALFEIFVANHFSREGSAVAAPINSRFIVGSSPDLAEKNRSYFDFFAETSLTLPPLRERSSDIPILVSRLAEKFGTRYGKEIKFNNAALEALISYNWPGNIRQLENVVERLVLTSKNNLIPPEALPIDVLLEYAESSGRVFVEDFDRQYIQAVLEECGGNKEKAARRLGINPIFID
ncbi:MAG: sigma-54 dependent transcriptional regulator [Candidatus Margulisiibacteriota bacterium]